MSGDVFGRIYEYFLTQFAGDKAHDGGEFFTPVSLVSLIAHILDPRGGIVFDPASGSGGMFVQSARTVEERGENATERLTFYGLEKNATTIRLAKMNLAVHGLEGDIHRAITYYEDPQELLGKVNTLMANPPFNVDEIDADKIKNDPRLPFGLPGVNKKNKVSNGNYLWISYFWSYLTDTGRAGFVMSSQASSAGRDESKVRQKLVETGDVDLMIAIRSNFFYTRSVPCELWFFDRAKPANHRDHVLMLDARNIFRKVTRKIFDFSPEQERNLRAVVQLYRGERDGFRALLTDYADKWAACRDDLVKPFPKDPKNLVPVFDELCKACPGYQATHPEAATELKTLTLELIPEVKARLVKLSKGALNDTESRHAWSQAARALAHELKALQKLVEEAQPLFMKESRETCKTRLLPVWEPLALHITDQLQQLHDGLYWVRQQDWLLKRFPDGKYRDVEGLCKRVSRAEIAANDWSLTPGRYVGVAPEEVDEDFDFEETLRAIHGELAELNEEAVQLAATIKKNFEGLWV
ncbi:MAG: SAM-dependent methyltransferase [Kiritimatiellae bacterium]|nr:SAM-dependent methyltransferase [Kiritimatiellia bacterium]